MSSRVYKGRVNSHLFARSHISPVTSGCERSHITPRRVASQRHMLKPFPQCARAARACSRQCALARDTTLRKRILNLPSCSSKCRAVWTANSILLSCRSSWTAASDPTWKSHGHFPACNCTRPRPSYPGTNRNPISLNQPRSLTFNSNFESPMGFPHNNSLVVTDSWGTRSLEGCPKYPKLGLPQSPGPQLNVQGVCVCVCVL